MTFILMVIVAVIIIHKIQEPARKKREAEHIKRWEDNRRIQEQDRLRDRALTKRIIHDLEDKYYHQYGERP